MDRDPVPWITLRQRTCPILRALTLVNDSDNRPGNPGSCGDRLISGLRLWRDKASGNFREIPQDLGARPASCVRCLERYKIDHMGSKTETPRQRTAHEKWGKR